MRDRAWRSFAGWIAFMVALAGGLAPARAAAGLASTAPPPGTITTIAGGPGGPALATQVGIYELSATYANGHLYVADGMIREIDTRTDWLTNPVGGGGEGFTPDGGATAGAPVSTAVVTADHAGNLVIFDSDRIRVVAASTGTFYGRAMRAWHIYTVAGTGVNGSSGDGGPALRARFTNVQSIAVDGSGNLLLADPVDARDEGGRVRMVAERSGTYFGRKMTRGDVYTVAGGGRSLGDGGPATRAEVFPFGVAADRDGNLIIADDINQLVRVVAARSGTFYGRRMTRGDIYAIAGGGRGLGDGGPATKAQVFPEGVAVDGAGNVLIVDGWPALVRVVAARPGTFYGRRMTRGSIYTIAGNGQRGFSGDGGPARKAELNQPSSVVLDGSGNVVITDVTQVRLVAVRAGTFYRQRMRPGDIYTIAGTNPGYFGDGEPARLAQISVVFGIAVDSHANISGIDFFNNAIRVVAGTTGTFFGMAMQAGDVYTVAGNGTAGFAGDGGPAVRAELREPWGVAADSAGNLVFADSENNRVRVVAAVTGTFYGQPMTAGNIYTIAGTGQDGFAGDGGPAISARLGTSLSTGIAIDGGGNVLIIDGDSDRIRMIAERSGDYYGQPMTAGDIYTVAGGGRTLPGDGGPATSAWIGAALGVAVDGSGNLLIASGVTVRVVAAQSGTFYGQVMSIGDIYTIAGTDRGGDFGDGVPALKAAFGTPRSLAVDQSGNVLVVDSSTISEVRVIAENSGVFYGVPMTAGDVYTVAGDGTAGDSGDGGPATRAELTPWSIALDQAGNLLIAAGTIREVAK